MFSTGEVLWQLDKMQQNDYKCFCEMFSISIKNFRAFDYIPCVKATQNMMNFNINNYVDYQLDIGLWVRAKVIACTETTVDLEYKLYVGSTEILKASDLLKLSVYHSFIHRIRIEAVR